LTGPSSFSHLNIHVRVERIVGGYCDARRDIVGRMRGKKRGMGFQLRRAQQELVGVIGIGNLRRRAPQRGGLPLKFPQISGGISHAENTHGLDRGSRRRAATVNSGLTAPPQLNPPFNR